MCGRYSLATKAEKIEKQFKEVEVGENLKINFNIAPTQHAYVITNTAPTQLSYLKWGLVPHWAKDTKNASRLINARMEGIQDKPSFRHSIRQRRCLVIADSFYEWQREGKQKIPFRILPSNDELLIMGGIWSVWYKGGEPLETFSIITTPPNQEVSPIHNRMPLLLQDKDRQEQWLADLQLDEVLGLMQTAPDGILKMYKVSERVNSVRNNDPALHDAATGGQTSLF
jgi:putative SOS response-associated peptidase YedK